MNESGRNFLYIRPVVMGNKKYNLKLYTYFCYKKVFWSNQ
jgi:hypothetical protein